MKKILLIALLILYSYSSVHAEKGCANTDFHTNLVSQHDLIHTLESSELEFVQTIETNAARGVLKASYYYCDKDHGFLLVKFHDRELLYKDVPLKTWFEFKFAESTDSYFIEEIKYAFISV